MIKSIGVRFDFRLRAPLRDHVLKVPSIGGRDILGV